MNYYTKSDLYNQLGLTTKSIDQLTPDITKPNPHKKSTTMKLYEQQRIDRLFNERKVMLRRGKSYDRQVLGALSPEQRIFDNIDNVMKIHEEYLLGAKVAVNDIEVYRKANTNEFFHEWRHNATNYDTLPQTQETRRDLMDKLYQLFTENGGCLSLGG